MSEPYDRVRWDQEGNREGPQTEDESNASAEDLEEARENVFEGWPSSEDVGAFASSVPPTERPAATVVEPREGFSTYPEPESELEPELEPEPEPDAVLDEALEEDLELDPEPAQAASVSEAPEEEPEPAALVDGLVSQEHAPGELEVPPGYGVLEGVPDGTRRAVGLVVSRFNGEITSRLLSSALEQLEALGVPQSAVTVMPVPGAFELPIGAMALARTRRFACIVALGCVIRGDTPHFDYVATEAASGLQLAALETGVPVSFGVLTLDRADQAEARIGKGAEAVRTALEMADLFTHLRAAAAR
jgi:6,7-dimethyl-8-ribityllumazine synthase